MGKILIPIIIGVAVSAFLMILSLINRKSLPELLSRLKSGDLFSDFSFSNLANYCKVAVAPKKKSKPSIECPPELDLDVLNCQVKLSEYQDGDCVSEAFDVEICGSIHSPYDVKSATLKISIIDTN